MARKKKNHPQEVWNYRTMFGPGLNFAASEAYKLLRTNIMFSFPEEGKCHVVGVTSSVQDEGKSSTTSNLAYALSETGKKVLLLEADLRRPTIGSKLNVRRVPGVTNLLVSREDFHTMVQQCSHAPNMDILTAGDIPPNPSELLGSGKMAELLAELEKEYEYIVVDLPPVTAVSDALALSPLLHGIIVVTKEGVSQKKVLEEALRLLKQAGTRILGFVYRSEGDVTQKKYQGKYGR